MPSPACAQGSLILLIMALSARVLPFVCAKSGAVKKKKCSFEVKVTIVDLIIIKKLCGVDVAKNNLQSVKS